MSVPRHRIRNTVIAMSLIAAGGVAAAPSNQSSEKPSCFFASEWNGWKAPTPDVLYLAVRYHNVYRVGLAYPSPLLQDESSRLNTITSGGSSICLPIDLRLQVTNGHGVSVPLIATSLVKLTPEEIKAIPSKYIPY